MRGQKEPDGIEHYKEWVEHQNDPGYGLNGRSPWPPLRRRPDRMGYVYLLIGAMLLIAAVCGIVTGHIWGALFLAAFAALNIAVGIVLLKSDTQKAKGKRKAARTSKRRVLRK